MAVMSALPPAGTFTDVGLSCTLAATGCTSTVTADEVAVSPPWSVATTTKVKVPAEVNVTAVFFEALVPCGLSKVAPVPDARFQT